MADSFNMLNTVRRRAHRCARLVRLWQTQELERFPPLHRTRAARAFLRVAHAHLARIAAQTVTNNPMEATAATLQAQILARTAAGPAGAAAGAPGTTVPQPGALGDAACAAEPFAALSPSRGRRCERKSTEP